MVQSWLMFLTHWSDGKMKKHWSYVEGYDELYQVSNTGDVKRNGKILRPGIANGYPKVILHKNGKKNFYVHRLVGKSFIPNPENKPQINHLNGVKTDNRVENLEWCSRAENQKHSFQLGLQCKKGEMHHLAKLTEKDVKEIKNFEGLYLWQIGSIYGISKHTVGDIINGRRWKHMTEVAK